MTLVENTWFEENRFVKKTTKSHHVEDILGYRGGV
jgi:hypothetical protein